MSCHLWSLVEPSLRTGKSHIAWICRQKNGNREVSYQMLYDGTLTLASQLRGMGIGQGDTVGIYAANGPEWTVAALAAWKLGAMIAPIHIGNSDEDIAYQIQAVKPRLMLVTDKGSDYADTLPVSLSFDHQAAAAEQDMPVVGDMNDPAVRIYTSGSTGVPKIVRLSHSNLASNVMAATHIHQFTRNDRFISLLPFSHAMGLMANLLLPVRVGSTVVAPQVLAATEVLAALSEEKISVVVAVPRLFRNIMNGLENKFDKSGPGLKIFLGILRNSPMFMRRILNAPIRKKLGGRISVWVSGGSHLDGEISRYYHRLGLPLRQGYGLTETSPLVSVQQEFDQHIDSVGKPIEHVSVKINNPDANGSGEVWIKGPNVMLGYEDDEQNRQVFSDGWLKTGDLARMDSAGRITLTGRLKRLIVTEAGKNVYPEELETLLERDRRIKEAGVFEIDGKPVCVLAMEGDDLELQAKAVLKGFNERTSPHNHITRFAIVEELPRTPLGKIALALLPRTFEEFEVRQESVGG